MSIVITDPDTVRLAEDLARRQGVSVDEAVAGALREHAERQAGIEDERVRRARQVLEGIWRMPVLDDRHPDEMLYDEHGEPR
jgi:antitoxin VapB